MTDRPGIRQENGSGGHGWTVSTVTETGSTNADLLAAIERGEHVVGTVLRADHQSAGRGRLDRRWSAPPGTNLLASLCFAPAHENAIELTHAVGVAAVRAVAALLPDASPAGSPDDLRSRIGLKWPNDVLVGDAKLAGVLAQRSARGPVVVGIGLNVGWAPDGAACVRRDLGIDITPHALLKGLLVELDHHLALPAEQRRNRYRERLRTLGRTVRIERPGTQGDLVGVAVDVDERGRLLVEHDGHVEEVDAGDVVHLRTPPADQPDRPG